MLNLKQENNSTELNRIDHVLEHTHMFLQDWIMSLSFCLKTVDGNLIIFSYY